MMVSVTLLVSDGISGVKLVEGLTGMDV